MSFSTENIQAVVDAYGGIYSVHPDADTDHRKCLAAALRKVVELVYFSALIEVEFDDWHQGYWTSHLNYRNQILDLVKSLEKTGGFQ